VAPGQSLSNTTYFILASLVPSTIASSFLLNLGNSQQVRFQYLGNLVDLESAISNKNKAVQLADDTHSVQPICLTNLSNSQLDRFEQLGFLDDLEKKAAEFTVSESQMTTIRPNQPC